LVLSLCVSGGYITDGLDNKGIQRIITFLRQTERWVLVPKVQVGENEPLDKALRRLKKKIEREGILKILKARKHYEKPSEKRRRKMRTARKRKFF
jgi:small subunit ribosomal protein S21